MANTEVGTAELATTSDKESVDFYNNEGLHCANNDTVNIATENEVGAQEQDESNAGSRINSPRRVRDIHLDGTADNMPDVDPYMLDERDLDIDSDAGGQAGSVYSALSNRSWKSLRTPRTLKTRSASSSAPRSSIASRARQIKDHEGDAFLSIDLMPEGGSKPASNRKGPSKTSVRGSQQSLLSATSSGLLSQHSARGDEDLSNARVRSRRVLSASSFVSPTIKHPPQPNHNVKMPFKHATKSPTMKATTVQPGQTLSENTALATHIVNKALRQQKPTQTIYIQGRLLKARLKPLEPVQMTEPTIDQCRGIVSQTRTYSACQSRTLQRWKAIMSGAQIQRDKNISQDLKDRASICESLHRTSGASSPNHTMDLLSELDDDDNRVETQENLGDAKLYNGDLPDSDKERPETTASSHPNSRSEPAHCEEADIAGPDLETPVFAARESSTAEQADLGPAESEPTQIGEANNVMKNLSTDNAMFHQSFKAENLIDNETNDPAMLTHFGSKRPHSATYPQESHWTRPSSSLRPKTAGDPTRKAVRFADEAKELSEQKQVEEKGNKNGPKAHGLKGKSSCRPHSFDSGFHDRDDHDEGDTGKGPDIGSTFLTQNVVQTSKGTLNSGISSNQQNGSKSAGNGKENADAKFSSLDENVKDLGCKSPQKSTGTKATLHSHKGSRNGRLLSNSDNKSKLKSGRKKPVKDKTTIHFSYSSSLPHQSHFSSPPLDQPDLCSTDPFTLISQLEESLNKIHVTDEPAKEDSDTKSRPISAYIIYDEVQDPSTALPSQPRIKDSSKLKQHLDKRFASYKHDKNVKSSEKSAHATKAVNDYPSHKENTEDSSVEENLTDHAGRVEGCNIDNHKAEQTISERDASNVENQQQELKLVVDQYFQDTDYSKYSRAANKPPASNSKKAKAYKILKSKARIGSGRPYSASVYADREVNERKSRIAGSKKDLRPNSAQIFSEKTDILSKHCLISNYLAKSRPDSATARVRPTSATCRSGSKSSAKQGSSEKSVDPKNLPTDSTAEVLTKLDDDQGAKPRLKSASRVTFADEKEVEDRPVPSGHRRANATRTKRSSSKATSSMSMMSSWSADDDDMFDANQMWEELPSDHSDEEYINNDDKDDCDPFMTKFALLQSQFEIIKAEVEGEKMRCVLDFQEKHSNISKEMECHDSEDNTAQLGGSSFLTSTDEGQILDIENDDDCKDDMKEQTHADTDQSGTSLVLVSPAYVPMAKYQRGELFSDTIISSLLYKKTNHYVKVTTRDRQHKGSYLSEMRKHLSGKKHEKNQSDKTDDTDVQADGEMKRKIKEEKNEVIVTVPSSKAETNPTTNEKTSNNIGEMSSNSTVSDIQTTSQKIRNSPAQKSESTDNGAHIERYLKTGKQEAETRKQLETDYPYLISIQKEAVPQPPSYVDSELTQASSDIQRTTSSAHTSSETRRQLEKDYPYLTSIQAGVSQSLSLGDERGQVETEEIPLSGELEAEITDLPQSDNYEDLLQAYRQHCMEDSDGDDDNDDKMEKKRKITSVSNRIKSHMNSREARRYRKNSAETDVPRADMKDRNRKEVSSKYSKSLIRQRPCSATTTDSGLESDNQSNLGEEVEINQSKLDSHTSGSSIDQSEDKIQQGVQSMARCDSGMSISSAAGCEDSDADRKASKTTISDSGHGLKAPTQSESTQTKQNCSDITSEALEVVAHAKKITKIKKPQKDGSEDMAALCKVPPLCFRLNARPPSGYLYYFAYGPNMNPDRLTTYLQCEKSPPRFWALLFGFDLVFNRKGSDETDTGGFPNLEYNPCSSVEGCIYQLTPGQLDCLDRFMGYPQHFEHVVLPTWMSNSTAPNDLGVAQYCVPAVTYIAQDSSTWQEPVQPNEYALSQCVKSADLMTPAYKQHLASFTSHSSDQPLAITAA